ncbi:MAG: alpha-1,2-fucosyltransferase [Halobacteriovorax sp.]|nr:alpha-1,2-fucosyltransferase [Halobacteriovorax sp.]|tara:strand:+ start:136463 stop:137329 length:867 start_codon:yes stop_codon:yes gene_type:complete
MSVCVKIKGGLGNQLFQYALGKKISKDLGAPLLLDTSYYSQKSFNGNDPREFELGGFDLKANKAKSSDLPILAKIPFADRLLKRLPKLSFTGMLYEEHTQGNIDPKKTPIYLDGYWQTLSHIEEVEDELRKDLVLKNIPDTYKPILKEIRSSNSVSIHVRRGDYITNSKNKNLFGECDREYYQRAIEKLQDETKELRFFVFSDDIKWAEENLDLPKNTEYVDKISPNIPAVSMYLMSQCKNHIIANSTFSWWGAWLSNSPSKKVIAPKNWYINGWSSKEMMPKGWILL